MQEPSSQRELLVQQIEAEPNNPRHHFMLGLSYSESNQWSCAIDSFRRVIELAPEVEAAHFNLGNACFELQRFSEAVEAYARAMQICPEWETQRNIGKALAANAQWDQAINQFQQSLQHPQLSAEQRATNLRDLGFATVQSGDWHAAYQFFDRAHTECPSDRSWECRLLALQSVVPGTEVLRQLGSQTTGKTTTRMVIEEARALQGQHQHRLALERLVENTQNATEPSILFESLAEVHFRQGHLSEALGCMHNLISEHPGTLSWLSTWVYLLTYGSKVTPKRIYENARRWYEKIVEQKPKNSMPIEAMQIATPRRANFGILVNANSHSVVSLQILPWLRHRQRDSMQITLLWDHWGDCPWAHELRGLVDHWRPIAMWTEVGLANWLQQNEISVLVDTVGHGPGSRLSLPSLCPTCSHLVWNYQFQTSGSDDVDFVVYDREIAKLIDQQFVSERIVSPLGPVWCATKHTALERTPAERVQRRPGPVRFGFVGALSHVSPESIDLWTMVLQAVPGSMLIARTDEWECSSLRAELMAAFARRGIESDRILCESSLGKQTAAQRLEDVDVFLDTAACNSLIGILDALAMGIPVVSLSGQRPPELISRAIQEHCVNCITCAQSQQHFIQAAVEVAQRVTMAVEETLMRQTEFLESPFCSPENYAGSIDQLLISLLEPTQRT